MSVTMDVCNIVKEPHSLMRRILLSLLWITVFLFVAQVTYFVFFSARSLKYNEGIPFVTERILADVGNVSHLYNDSNGVIWIGTEGHGIYRYEIVKGVATPIGVPDILQHATVRSVGMDRCGRLWVGTSRHGLFVRKDEEWKHYDIGERISAIQISPVGGTVVLATDVGMIGYDTEKDEWLTTDSEVFQPTSLAFDTRGNLFVGTASSGIFRLSRGDTSHFRVNKRTTAPRRFGPGSAPNVSPVPLDPCGVGLPSNQINALLVGSDGTIWAGTSAGLAWSRDDGESWTFLRGRDYGDKMRGLLAGTPHGWKELPRIRFGELLPEDHVSLLTEDEAGQIWIGTASLGCIALKPSSLYRTTQPKNDDLPSQRIFLEEVAAESNRFYGTLTDRIAAMTPLSGSEVLTASSIGLLDKITCPGIQQEFEKPSKPEQAIPKEAFPSPFALTSAEKSNDIFLGADRTTQCQWLGKYGTTYALIGGGDMPHDKLIAFDESICQVRLFVGNVGNRTRPLERVILLAAPHHHHDGDAHECPPELTAWTSAGNTVPRTADGQNLWCEIKLNLPGQYELSLYFADPVSVRDQTRETRDYLIEIFPEPSITGVRIPRNDWLDFGRRVDEWATRVEPLASYRVADFRDGIHVQFLLTGPGTYFVKIDKNYGRKVDLCAVLIDRLDSDNPSPDIFDMTSDQSSDEIP